MCAGGDLERAEQEMRSPTALSRLTLNSNAQSATLIRGHLQLKSPVARPITSALSSLPPARGWRVIADADGMAVRSVSIGQGRTDRNSSTQLHTPLTTQTAPLLPHFFFLFSPLDGRLEVEVGVELAVEVAPLLFSLLSSFLCGPSRPFFVVAPPPCPLSCAAVLWLAVFPPPLPPLLPVSLSLLLCCSRPSSNRHSPSNAASKNCLTSLFD